MREQRIKGSGFLYLRHVTTLLKNVQPGAVYLGLCRTAMCYGQYLILRCCYLSMTVSTIVFFLLLI